MVTNLIPYLGSPHAATRTEAAFAITQSMRGEPLPLDAGGTQIDGVLAALLGAAGAEREAAPLGEIARSLGRLPYERAEQVIRAEEMIREVLTLSRQLALVRRGRGSAIPAVTGAVAGAEQIARVHFKLSQPSEPLIGILRDFVNEVSSGVPLSEMPPPAMTFQALVTAHGVDEDALKTGLKSRNADVRRLAVQFLGGGGSTITGQDRLEFLRNALSDPAWLVRYEGVRAYARTHARTDGCDPLLGMVTNASQHVALAAIDAVGDVCSGDQDVVNRMVSEARTPGSLFWQKEAHALVSLAKLSPAHAGIPLSSHSRHTTWQVRMYAARAAAILNQTGVLERLAADEHDNVREATLAPLRRLKGPEAEPFFVAALGRRDYQLLRTAAIESKGLPATRDLHLALLDALKRVTEQKKETSRDTRVALIERLRDLSGDETYHGLLPLLRDFDPKVAETAARVLQQLTGSAFQTDPQPLPHQALPTAGEIAIVKEQNAVLMMQSGRNIELELDPDVAPMAAVRFLRLSNANYFDRLTFHRVVANFVVQGGSPGANEYAGDGPYLRDEISRETHAAGTIGLSTRGRDTGDAQLFINLVHNPRLDFEYTVFGRVSPESLTRVMEIVEGDVIRDVRWMKRAK